MDEGNSKSFTVSTDFVVKLFKTADLIRAGELWRTKKYTMLGELSEQDNFEMLRSILLAKDQSSLSPDEQCALIEKFQKLQRDNAALRGDLTETQIKEALEVSKRLKISELVRTLDEKETDVQELIRQCRHLEHLLAQTKAQQRIHVEETLPQPIIQQPEPIDVQILIQNLAEAKELIAFQEIQLKAKPERKISDPIIQDLRLRLQSFEQKAVEESFRFNQLQHELCYCKSLLEEERKVNKVVKENPPTYEYWKKFKKEHVERIEHTHLTQISNLKQQLTELSQALGKAHVQIDQLHTKYSDDTASLADKLQTEHEAKLRLAKHLRSEKDEHTTTRQTLETCLEQTKHELSCQIEAKTHELSQLSHLLAQKTQEYTNLTLEEAHLRKELAYKSSLIKELEAELLSQNEKIQELTQLYQKSQAQHAAELQELNNNLHTLRNDLKKKQRESETLAEIGAKFETRLEHSNKNYTDLVSRYETVTSECEMLKGLLKQAEDEHHSHVSQQNSLKNSQLQELQDKLQPALSAEAEQLLRVRDLEQQLTELREFHHEQLEKVHKLFTKWQRICSCTPKTNSFVGYCSAIAKSAKHALKNNTAVAELGEKLEKAQQHLAGLQKINDNLLEQKEILKKQLSLPQKTPWKESLLSISETLQLDAPEQTTPRQLAKQITEKIKKKVKSTKNQRLKQKNSELKASLAHYREATAHQEVQLQQLKQRISDLELHF